VRDSRRRARTEALCAAALALFLEHGIEAVTIEQVTRRAGVAKGSFYRSFEDKSRLVEALFEPVAQGAREAFSSAAAGLSEARSPEGLAAVYRALAARLGGLVLAEPGVVRLYLQECRAPAVGARAPVGVLAREFQGSAVALTEAAQRHGLLRPVDPRVSAAAVIGAVEHLLVRFLQGEDVGPPEEVPGALIALVLDGLRAGGPTA
jgi:AcrR family transcriptional regulator